MSARQLAARTIRDLAWRQALRARNVHRAQVMSTDPVRAVLLHNEQVIEDGDDLHLGGTLRLLTKTVPLSEGDTLLLHRDVDHFVAFDVLTDSTI